MMVFIPFEVMEDGLIFKQIQRVAFQHFRVTASDSRSSDSVPALPVYGFAVDPGLFRDFLLFQSAGPDFSF